MNDCCVSVPNENYEDKPSHLCKKCGLCCRVVIPSYTYEELQEMVENNESEAINFLKIFVPYNSKDEIPEYVMPHYKQIIAAISDDENFPDDNITVFHCKFINEDNTCSIYSERPDCCKRAPHTGWSLFTHNCGYSGWQFIQREKQKQKVRKLKEILYEIEICGNKSTKYEGMTIDEIKANIAKEIEPYEKYGAKLW